MKTNTEKFVEAVDELGYAIDESRVDTTTETVQNFIDRWGEPNVEEWDSDELGEVKVYTWSEVQVTKGKARGDLLVMDFGETRLSYFGGEA